MVTQFQLEGKPINIYEIEHYILHMLSELNSNRNDGWVEEHYRKELKACEDIISDYMNKLNEEKKGEEIIDWVRSYEYEKLESLRKRIHETKR